ncbi:MAG: acyltransferase family protein [Pseudomonadota bacterium]
MTATSAARRYDIDALRVLAFGLLILYHVGMYYVADWDWHIKSRYTVEWLQEPMRFLNQWRMSLLFVISGLALSFVWDRYTPGRLAWRRSWRLVLPLVFGMAVIVAPQPYAEMVAADIISPGYLDFYHKYLTFSDFPGDAYGGEEQITWTWNHLWYLPYLLLYTLLLTLVGAVLPRLLANLGHLFQRLRGVVLIAVPVGVFTIYGIWIFPHYPYIDHGLVGDVYAHALYGTLFLCGFLMGRDSAFWQSLGGWRHALLTIAMIAYVALRTQDWWVGESPTHWLETLAVLNVYVNRWTWILTILAFGHAHLNRPLPGLAYATAAIFPWYILHQSITVIAGYNLSPLALGPVIEPMLVLGLTVLGCALGYELLIRRWRWLHPLFGVNLPPLPARCDVDREIAGERFVQRD